MTCGARQCSLLADGFVEQPACDLARSGGAAGA